MNMMTKDELYNALVAVTNEVTGEKAYSEKEARAIIDKMSDAHLKHISNIYESPEEWADYMCM
jgi:hypothetical protein